ncbi:helix-turn-helix domain-containing protein [Senegalia massiliensis]|uniref:helix-turn-helix domain-containing protein n=1 Tax=Senegalia massiliensis TaxID=1720316 RepID=UPI00102F66D6|nr:XRE family transcriptional regulator [Senegalia massiliensis]
MIDIGSEIKELRKSNNMTLKDLSEKTGLSIGFLSQFERGLSTIAVDSLELIAKALNIELSHFILKPKTKKEYILKSFEQEVYEVINNKFVHYNLSNNLNKKTFLPRKINILPMGKDENITEYSHKGEEFVYILEGTLTLFLDSKRYDLYPGDSAHYNSEKMHNWANYTSKMVKLIVVSTPNHFSESEVIQENE